MSGQFSVFLVWTSTTVVDKGSGVLFKATMQPTAVFLSKALNPPLVLVQPRKTGNSSDMTKILLTGTRKNEKSQ